jgi:hypothetical protein
MIIGVRGRWRGRGVVSPESKGPRCARPVRIDPGRGGERPQLGKKNSVDIVVFKM